MTGTIKRLVRDRGFGFITPLEGGDDLFFHRSAVLGVSFDTLAEGIHVDYEVGSNQKGPRAEKITISAAQ